jgi:hypothetical protein
MARGAAAALLVLLLAPPACWSPGTLRSEAGYALGYEGEVSELFSPCELAEPSSAFTLLPGSKVTYRATSTGVGRFRCGTTHATDHEATVEVAARLEVQVQPRIVSGERASYSVRAFSAHGRELRIEGERVILEGAVGHTVAHGCMDFGSALGDVLEGHAPGMGQVRATFAGLTAAADVEVLPAGAGAAAGGAATTAPVVREAPAGPAEVGANAGGPGPAAAR